MYVQGTGLTAQRYCEKEVGKEMEKQVEKTRGWVVKYSSAITLRDMNVD